MSSLTSENLAKIEAMLDGQDANDFSCSRIFVRTFPGVFLTRCDPSDVDGEILTRYSHASRFI